MKLADRVAIVTGSGSGIGKAIVLAFAREGAWVVVCDLSAEFLAQTAEELQGSDAKVLAILADVTDSTQVNSMVGQVVEIWGRVDVLVNNAGGGKTRPGFEATEEEWDAALDLNLKSQFLCCKAVVPHMERQGHGRIINIASNNGKYRGFTGVGGIPYGAAKAGVMQLTRSAAHAVGRHGITVNAIAPGNVLSESATRDIAALPAEKRERILRQTPLGRFARPEEMASIAVFLASDDSSYVTGTTILASGGLCSS